MIRKQATLNLVINYAGFTLAAVNYILLMPLFFTSSDIGLIRLLTGLTAVFSSTAGLGANVVIVRFFPHYRTADKSHHGFVHLLYGMSLLGYVLLAGAYLIFQESIQAYYREKSAVFADEYYLHLLPLAFFALWFNLMELQMMVALRTVFSSLMREVVLRIFFTLGVGLFAFNYITLEQFVLIYILGHICICILQSIEIIQARQFRLLAPVRISRAQLHSIMTCGVSMMLSSAAFAAAMNIDSIMLAAMAGLSVVGVFGVYANIAVLISMPYRAIGKIVAPMVANAWAENDRVKIKSLYAKSGMIQAVVGIWIFIGVIACREDLFLLLRRPEYSEQFSIYLFLGAAHLISSAFSINNTIISTSHRYSYDLWFNLVFLAACVPLNYALIPAYGGAGAAAAYCLAVLVVNVAKWRFIKQAFGLGLLHWRVLKPYPIAAATLGLTELIPHLDDLSRIHVLALDVLLRGVAITIIFYGLTYLFRVSPDLNEWFKEVFRRTQRMMPGA